MDRVNVAACVMILALLSTVIIQALPEPEEEFEYSLDFHSITNARAGIAGGTYKCRRDMERCLREAGNDICAPGETFEILKPLEFRADGTPTVNWRCIIVREKPPI